MFLYNCGIRLYSGIIRLAAAFKPKARLWINGRKNWEANLRQKTAALSSPIWIHCASLGEFEQGRPLIEEIKRRHPSRKILLTFFSPSGYEIRKNYEFADVVIYMPVDTKANARKFLEIVQPAAAVFVKYEFWLNFLHELKKNQVPTFLISAVFKKHQPFFKWYGGIFRKALPCYHTIFTQDEASLQLLKSLGVTQTRISGDTRFDRVLEISRHPRRIDELTPFITGYDVLIGGSTWPKDEEFLLEAYNSLRQKHNRLKLIIAPHEIDQANIERLWNLIGSKGLSHCFITGDIQAGTDVVIVNTMGYLSSIYQYGKIAVIGGGFNDGIHNVVEPAVFGLPVLFGPNHAKFNEAEELLRLGGAFEFSDKAGLLQRLESLISKESEHSQASVKAANYVASHAGATAVIMQVLEPLL
ncbi:MAG: 3-deoxy-D-manno-octulosonic acid transferase [Bacteroidetes bacterium]|nr:3-deoxy-D-manno-octulosonic acid transferase [Bacteroidota bacterium]